MARRRRRSGEPQYRDPPVPGSPGRQTKHVFVAGDVTTTMKPAPQMVSPPLLCDTTTDFHDFKEPSLEPPPLHEFDPELPSDSQADWLLAEVSEWSAIISLAEGEDDETPFVASSKKTKLSNHGLPWNNAGINEPLPLSWNFPSLMGELPPLPNNGGMPSLKNNSRRSRSPFGYNSAISTATLSTQNICVPLRPVPTHFQGDMDQVAKTAQVPKHSDLLNFPEHSTTKKNAPPNPNLPEGMRSCVMCGQACACASGKENKKRSGGNNCLDNAPVIPGQNKGLCTHCDVNVWIVKTTGLQIKWCKGCKNFKAWAAFGEKGMATKCLCCRERQRKRYVLTQKKDK